MIRVTGFSHYLQAIHDGDGLPDLDPVLRPLCREPFRRIDRFIQLALLGSGQCVEGRKLDAGAGLYVSTGVGPVGNNIIVQETLIKNRQLPKPFHFVNTLGSSTGYYVAKNLGLRGQALFVSRRGGAFQSALGCALADLELGVLRQALVGAVEECTLPLAQHRQRQGLAPGAPVSEGTHWMLLEAGETAPGRPLELRRFEALQGLSSHLSSALGPGDRLALGLGLGAGARKSLGQLPSYQPDLVFHDSHDAAVMGEFLRRAEKGRLYLASGDEDAGWELLSLG
jgi:hypothetical protein